MMPQSGIYHYRAMSETRGRLVVEFVHSPLHRERGITPPLGNLYDSNYDPDFRRHIELHWHYEHKGPFLPGWAQITPRLAASH